MSAKRSPKTDAGQRLMILAVVCVILGAGFHLAVIGVLLGLVFGVPGIILAIIGRAEQERDDA